MIIGGGTLAAAAAAVRLAKLGHQVQYVGRPETVGGHWRTDLPPVLGLPATWRDLFRKSGRTLDAELLRTGRRLETAPATQHRFSDGTELTLPAERGAQFSGISRTFGTAAAQRWRDLLDDLDQTWLALRHAGVEEPAPERRDGQLARRLLRGTTLNDLADRVGEPHLAEVITSQGVRSGTDSNQAPALLATRLVIERTFGRWQLSDSSGPLPGEAILDSLVQRMRTRKIGFLEQSERIDLDLGVWIPRRSWFAPRLRPALAPRVTRTDNNELTEVVTYSQTGLIIDWPGIRHDFRTTYPDIAWGFAPDDWASWWARPKASSAGNEPWAELANAAMEVYAYHLRVTGRDVRPSNRNYRP